MSDFQEEAKEVIAKVETEAKQIYATANTKVFGLTKHFDIIHIILIAVAIVCVTSIIFNYYRPPNPVTPREWTVPPESKQTKGIDRILIPGPVQIVTIEKQVIIEKLKLPDSFKNNSSAQAISSADLQPSKSGYTVVGTIDTKKGTGGILAKEKERSWMGLPGNLSIGTRYGITTDLGRQEAVVYGKYQPVRFGDIYMGIYGEANSKPEGKAMIDFEYKIKSD